MSKKGTKSAKEVRQYDKGDVVLGKVRGFPPWPGMVVDPADVPPNVLNEQPPGKKVTFYCVLFFPAGDYAWLHSKDISALKKHEIEAFLADETRKKKTDLGEGYRHALDPKHFLEKLKEDRAALALELEEREQNAEVDQLESEPDDGQDDDRVNKKSKATASKKRKRESEVESKPKKAPKAKKDSIESTKKKSVASKGKKNGVKSKTMVESEDEGDNAEEDADDEEGAGPSKKVSPPAAKKAKRDKDEGDDLKISTDPQADQVRDWRHRLQKVFLSNKTLPKPELMPEIDILFTTVEEYESMTIEQLQHSKIGKVMRHIAAIEDGKIPGDDEFKFRTRAKDLVDKWHQILNANKPPNGSPTTSTGQTNGKLDKENLKDKEEDDVTKGTQNLDLNGEGDNHIIAGNEEDANGDASMLADITMSEA